MKAFILLGQLLFGKLPFCSLVGGIIGVIVGTFMSLTQDALGTAMPPMTDIITRSLLLALVAWVFVVLLFGVWLRYGITQIAAPAAVNAILTSFFTVWFNLLIRVAWLAPLIGLLVGILIGLILCRFCRPLVRATGRLTDG
jgi:hypothetical protein